MKLLRHRTWFLPLLAFSFPIGLALHDRYEQSIGAQYRKPGNASCALARGYARKFEDEQGHRPSLQELKPWAVEHFRADLEKMEIETEHPWWIRPREPEPRQPKLPLMRPAPPLRPQ